MVPVNSVNTDLILFSGVSWWSRMTHTYSLPERSRAWTVFVASSRVMGNMPVTLGSSVPPCPASFRFRSRFVHAVTSWLLGPEGLSRFMTPNRM